MQLSKPLILFALFFLTMLTTSQAQCELRIDYSFQESPNSLYAISLRSQAGIETLTATLHDLYKGEAVQTRRVNGLSGQGQQVFTKVEPSLYIIYIRKDGCEEYRSLGPISGIKIGD